MFFVFLSKNQLFKKAILQKERNSNKKFLELVCLKKLTGADSALKTKTKDFAVLSNKIDVAQLTKCLERHDAVLIEQRSEDGKTLEKLWVATAKDTFKLMK